MIEKAYQRFDEDDSPSEGKQGQEQCITGYGD
jgi:hypothetical protein